MNGRDTNPSQQQPGMPQQQGGSAGGSQQDQYASAGQQQGGNATARRDSRNMGPAWARRGGPFELLRQMDEEVDRMVRQVWGGARNLARGGGSAGGQGMAAMWIPQVEVFEQGGKFCVQADLPGMKREDIQLQVEGDQLVLQGERRSSFEEPQQQGGGYFHSERSYGSFFRTIPLPEGVNPDSAQASFRDGVLRVEFDAPQQPQSRSRKLDIRE